jgi:DNA sulfur modification protein DndC
MQRQAVTQQTLTGFEVPDFDSVSPEAVGSYSAPRYIEVKRRPTTQADQLALANAHPLQEAAIQVLLNLIRAGRSLSVAASWGKDSFACVVLMIEAVRRAVGEGVYTTHFITTSSTLVENPAMESHALRCQDEVRTHCEEHGLPIEIHTVFPSLASSFVVTTIGRGTLPRSPENSSVKKSSSKKGGARQCSSDWKAAPQERLVNELNDRLLAQNGHEIITIIGTRLEESATRAERMTARGESATTPVRNDTGHLVLSIIKHWSLNDVWNTIEMVADPTCSPYVPVLSPESVARLFKLYRDANDGVCGVSLGDGGNRAACGSRHGCFCCSVTGDKDKSMESMLESGEYDYMKPLNAFRNLLVATQFDFDKRELFGRTVSPAGFIAIQPDVFAFRFRKELLWYLLSMDANERERAEKMEANIAAGRVEDTPENRMLASPMFENCSLPQLALVDFHWGMHYAAECAFPALNVWYEVNVLGRRRLPPEQTKAPKIDVPTKRWFKVGNFDHGAPSDGLRSYDSELWNSHRHAERTFAHRVVGGAQTVWFDEDDNLTVDPLEACAFITCTFPEMVIESRNFTAIEGARFLLNEGIVKLPKGQAQRYQEIAQRNVFLCNLMARLNLSPAEMERHLVTHSITNAEHTRLLPPSPQADMFKPPQTA